MPSLHLFPTLDPDGWVETSTKVADYLVSHFFLADYSQTAFFPDNVASFAWILHRYQGNITTIITETQQRLNAYFSTQFTNVDVQLTELADKSNINSHSLSLYLVFTDTDGVEHNLSRMLKYSGMKVTELIAVING